MHIQFACEWMIQNKEVLLLLIKTFCGNSTDKHNKL